MSATPASSAVRPPGQELALVTGAAGGIGSAVVERLLLDGYRIGCLDVNAVALTALCEDRPQLLPLVADICDEESVAAAFAELAIAAGDPWLVVNVAGYFDRHSIAELSLAEWNRFLAVNLTGPFLVCRAALPTMLAASSGCIINVASTAGVRGGRDRAAYTAAKGGLVQFTRSLALDHGKDGIRVNIVAPGLIDTPMADWIRHDPAAMAEFDSSIPAGRIGTPAEVAEVVAFIASPAASYMYGSTVMVDGGVFV